MKKILFVCTGNTCRSPMAEAFLKSALSSDKELEGHFSVASGGIAAPDGSPASSNSIEALKKHWGIDLSLHKAHSINRDELENSALILTMTRSHKDAILSVLPHLKPRVYTLKEFIRDDPADRTMEEYDYTLDIPDPFGSSIHVYKMCAEQIKEAVDKLIAKLKKGYNQLNNRHL